MVTRCSAKLGVAFLKKAASTSAPNKQNKSRERFLKFTQRRRGASALHVIDFASRFSFDEILFSLGSAHVAAGQWNPPTPGDHSWGPACGALRGKLG